jgi:hypothetical protein
MKRRPPTPVIIGIVAVDLVAAFFAWRDLDRRRPEQIRGTKLLWRVVMLSNPGNSFGYWLFGRRRGAAAELS